MSWTPADVEALTHHSALGVVLVREIEFLSGSLDGIRHHHERWDGLGYPDGLAGDEIPLVSRVIAVADAFDALTTDRAERPAFTPAQALRQIEQRRGRQFDPQVVAALATVLERHEWPVTTPTRTSWTGCAAISTTTTRSPGSASGATTPKARRDQSGPCPGRPAHPVADEPSPRRPVAGIPTTIPVA